MGRRAGLLVLLVLALAAALRAFRLEDAPPGFYIDEASVGVEAHSILETGRDQSGKLLPALVPAVQDWKHPLYIYATALSEKALGPTRLAVRLPGVVFGTLTVLLLVLLGLELTKDARVAVAAGLVLAVTPWHIHYSRGWEAITLDFGAVLALWLYFRARRLGGAKRFALAGAGAGLFLYTYVAAKLLLPALLVALAVLEWREGRAVKRLADRLRAHADAQPLPTIRLQDAPEPEYPRPAVGWREALALAAVLAVTCAPMVLAQIEHFAAIQTRFNAVSVFREEHPLQAIGRSYLAHLDPGFLFFRGDANLRHSWPGWGLLLFATAPFCLLGLIRALARHQLEDLFLLAWLAIYPLGGALTTEGVPHATRALLGAPLFALLAAQGAFLCIDRVLARGGRAVLGAILAGALLANAGFAVHSYFTEYPRTAGFHWTAGVERLIPELAVRRGEIKHVHFMPGPVGGVAIIREHVVFFTRFDPELDPARPDSYFRFEPGVVSWARFLAKLPRDEVVVAWASQRGGQQWGVEPWLRVRDAQGDPAFEVYRGFGR